MTRSSHIWLAFTLCAAVLLSVMGWVSRTTLRLDRLQAEAARTADLEERARLALWRLDSWLASLIIEESARGYGDYEAFAATPRAYNRSFAELDEGGVLVRSPLLAPASSHVLLHFQLHPDGRLTSPQVPTGHPRDLAEAGILSREQLERAAQRLADFQRILAAPADSGFRTDLASSNAQNASSALPMIAGFDNAGTLIRETERPLDVVVTPTLAQSEPLPGQAERGPATLPEAVPVTRMTEQQQFRNEAEFNSRANNFIQAQQRLSVQNVLRQYESPLTPAPTLTAAAQGVFRAVWLDDALVLARRVDLGSDFRIQGCWLDWTNLRRALLDSIRDLFPEAELEPVTHPPGEPNARLLASLPVQLLTGSAASTVPAVWTPLRMALLVAWVGVLIAGLAVALLLRGTLSLSERRAAFVSAVTHELRTPLTTFKLYSEMLAEGMVTDESSRQGYLATLCAEANRLTHLVDNVLAYARLERGGTRHREERIALGDLLERVKPRLLQRAEQAGLTLAEDADAQARRALVRLNVAAVEQILFNLVDNACKYAAPTASTRTLHLETRPGHGRFAILRVRDHGPGLTTEALRHLFQPFGKSAQSAAETVPGVGLGLALSRQLSRRLGGDLRLDRQVQDGAAFNLWLPLSAGHETAGPMQRRFPLLAHLQYSSPMNNTKDRAWHRLRFLPLLLGAALGVAVLGAAAPTPGHTGKTIHVSKLGDDSDGASWAKAFRTVQTALDAIPDDRGGHRIVVRPDTYLEANLFPAHRGAAGAPNELVGDWDGSLGSGASGWVVLDAGDATKGFKSYDWWGTIRAYKKAWSPEHQAETFSSIGWDRWILRRLYATGGDAGLFFDLVDKPEPFTVTVEDCVSLGRAFGGGVANILSRPDEPSVFRRCQLWCLDWWGDAAGAYVRAEHPEMPPHPDVLFEDCTLVGPDNALQAGNPGYAGFTRVKLRNCRLVSLNFSQPQGKPGTGIIHSTIEGRFLQVDLEDSLLMGCKVFGAGKGDVSYAVQGDVQAYVQFQQEIPEGMLRLGHWPVEAFQTVLPPAPPPSSFRARLRLDQPEFGNLCEVAPVIWRDRLTLMKCVRPASGGERADYYLKLEDVETGRELARFAEGYSLASAFVKDGALYAFASRFTPDGWNDVTLFQSADLRTWESKVVIAQENEQLFNSSVCAGPAGFVMAYESNDPRFPAFTIKFATSANLTDWTKVPDVYFGTDRYAACPSLRYVDGWYYLLYLEHRQPRWFFETYLARSRDLKQWELSAANPILTPGPGDGINASDPDIVDFNGQTHLYYSVGDQRTWSKLKRAVYPGPLRGFFEDAFAGGSKKEEVRRKK